MKMQSSNLFEFIAPTSRQRKRAALHPPPKVCPLARACHHSQLGVVQVDSESLFMVERIPKRMFEEQGAAPDRGVNATTRNGHVDVQGVKHVAEFAALRYTLACRYTIAK